MGLFKRLNELESDLRETREKLNDEVKHNKEFRAFFVACDVCGCLLDKNMAVEGEHYIQELWPTSSYTPRHYPSLPVETIAIRWYCKLHAPKSKVNHVCPKFVPKKETKKNG